MAKDPYRYFRVEAHELLEGMTEGVLSLEQEAGSDVERSLLRYAHTLKGAARVVKHTVIAELAHKIEDVLSRQRDAGAPIERADVEQALRLLDEIRAALASLDAPVAPPTAVSTGAVSEETLRSVRVPVRRMDELLARILELRTATVVMRREGATLDEARQLTRSLVEEVHAPEKVGAASLGSRLERLLALLEGAAQSVGTATEQVTREVNFVQDLATELRLVPAQALTQDLQRAVRDAAVSLDKTVSFGMSGADTRLDAYVLSLLRAALLHVVRNSVAHGIEPAAERARAGKSAEGSVELTVERRGHRVLFRCRDDGRGLDGEAIRRVAVERRLVTADEGQAMDLPALVQLLIRGGVSTSRRVTEVSGRGVGLDVVRDIIERLGGELHISSVPGQGTTTDLLVPVSLSSMPALCVEVDGGAALIPLDAVKTTLRLGAGDVARFADGEKIVVDDKTLPFLSLSALLGGSRRGARRCRDAVVLSVGGKLLAVGVDRVQDVRNVLVRSLPEHVEVDVLVAGAALDEEGVPQLVLAPSALLEAAHAGVARLSEVEDDAAAATRRLPLLVVDDSLTTRMLEQSILESAGYEVDLAVSAEQGLQMARQRPYGAFIVDVEMPGMNGFEFIASTRKDPALKDVPSILVTSRADPADKLRGKEVGARAYIVKGQFDQRELLAAIERLGA